MPADMRSRLLSHLHLTPADLYSLPGWLGPHLSHGRLLARCPRSRRICLPYCDRGIYWYICRTTPLLTQWRNSSPRRQLIQPC
jgi:hypothetical protein